jgi:hypothetical protein
MSRPDKPIMLFRSLLVTSVLLSTIANARASTARVGTPFLHVTDLYRPHVDPDDHWDLACVYALAQRGAIDLKGIVIDYPPAARKGCNPDIVAVAQMNRVTGLTVPVAVGSPHPMRSRDDIQPNASASDLQGVRMILDTLRTSDRRVVITVTGSSRDVAVASRRDRNLFAGKCTGVYLNAGTSRSEENPSAKPEYNVTLDKVAYAALFDLPCPVYWLPCFEGTESDGGPVVREYASHYVFRQDEILPRLSPPVRNYFACMFGRYTDSDWLGYLTRVPKETLLAEHGGKDRHMWCTAGLFHAAGYVVAARGEIRQRDGAESATVFQFEPIRVTCDENGVSSWHADPSSQNRFIPSSANEPATTQRFKRREPCRPRKLPPGACG